MTVKELRHVLNRTPQRYDNIELYILAQTHQSMTLGARQAVKVKFASKGVDWENERFIVEPEENLRVENFKKYLGEE